MILMKQLIAALLALLSVGAHPDKSALEPKNPSATAYSTTKHTFSQFRGAAETLPAPLRIHLSNILSNNGHQLNPVSVQHQRIAGQAVWVFLTWNRVCLAQAHRGGVACSSIGEANRTGVSLGVFSPPTQYQPAPHDFLLLGLAPDAVSHVVITIGKRSQTIPVRRNLYGFTADQPILIRRYIRHNVSVGAL